MTLQVHEIEGNVILVMHLYNELVPKSLTAKGVFSKYHTITCSALEKPLSQ